MMRNAIAVPSDGRQPPFAMFAKLPRSDAGPEGATATVSALLHARAVRARYYLRCILADALNLDVFRWMPTVAAVLVVPLLLVPGGVLLAFYRREPLVWFGAAYLCVISMFPSYASWHTTWRYLVPVFPAALLILYATAVLGLGCVSRGLTRSSAPAARLAWAPAAVLVAISAIHAPRPLLDYAREFRDPNSEVYACRRGVLDMQAWLRANNGTAAPILSDTILVAESPRCALVSTGVALQSGDLLASARRAGARYVVAWKGCTVHADVLAAIEAAGDAIRKCHENDVFLAARIREPDDAGVALERPSLSARSARTAVRDDQAPGGSADGRL
jgi:hypothetical protein